MPCLRFILLRAFSPCQLENPPLVLRCDSEPSLQHCIGEWQNLRLVTAMEPLGLLRLYQLHVRETLLLSKRHSSPHNPADSFLLDNYCATIEHIPDPNHLSRNKSFDYVNFVSFDNHFIPHRELIDRIANWIHFYLICFYPTWFCISVSFCEPPLCQRK